MAYTVPTWQDSPSTATAVSAADLNQGSVAIRDIDTRLVSLGINVKTDYGAVGDGVTNDTAAINSAIAAAVSNGLIVRFPPGTYVTTSTLDWRQDGLKVMGSGPQQTKILCTTNNIPIVQLGHAHQQVEALKFSYSSQQTTAQTNGNVAEFWHAFMCTYRRLRFELGYRCLYLPQSDADGSGHNTIFSCHFDCLQLNGWSLVGIEWKSFGANSTGNAFTNLYTQNNYTGSIATVSDGSILMADFDETVINQLNTEWNTSSAFEFLRLIRCGNFVINSYHCEQLTTAGGASPAGIVRVQDNTHLVINGMTVAFCTFPTGAGVQSLFRVGVNSNRLFVNGLRERNSTVTATTHSVVDYDSGTTGNTVQIRGVDTTGPTTTVTGDTATPANTYQYGDATRIVTAPVALTDAATIATNAALGSYFRVTLAGNRTLGNPTNLLDGQRIIWELIQDATGTRTITLDTMFAVGTTVTPITLTTTASKRDFLTTVYNATANKLYVTQFVKGY